MAASAVLDERSGPMKRSKFSEEQIVYALGQAESGTSIGDVCRQLGIVEQTFYAWKKKYAHLGVSELRRLRQLEEENHRLKRRLVADLSLDKHMLSEALRKKV
jgi:putative transposase